jgi:hypothetical protein
LGHSNPRETYVLSCTASDGDTILEKEKSDLKMMVLQAIRGILKVQVS